MSTELGGETANYRQAHVCDSQRLLGLNNIKQNLPSHRGLRVHGILRRRVL